VRELEHFLARHRVRAVIGLNAKLEVFDGQAIANLLAEPEHFWIAEQFLAVPGEMYPPIEADGEYARLKERWFNGSRAIVNQADLLEVKHPWMQLARAHPPQAARVLDLRGLHLDLPPERRLSLGDLMVQADLDTETFRLVDRSGRRVLPASLSAISDSGLPNRLRFLLMFGPGEARGVFPFAWSEGEGDIVAFHRLSCGNVVTRRRSWQIAVAGLRERLRSATDRQSYVLVDRWRRSSGLPDEGYYHELASCGKEKPQFVRFDSPSLCRLFVASLERMAGASLYFVEPLPSPTDFPLDAFRERRGFELLIDQLAIREPGGNSSAG